MVARLVRLVAALAFALVPGLVVAQPSPRSAQLDDNSDSIAVVIGNRKYTESTVEVKYAHNDADAMKLWLISALGFREQNIIVLKDTTLAGLRSVFGREDDTPGRLLGRVKRDRSNVFVFYSGHGAPDVSDGKATDRAAYLIPVDVSPERASDGYSLDLLTRNLDRVREAIGPNRWLVVMLDACFTGNSAGGAIVQVSGGLAPRALDAMNGIVKVTATSRDQVASWDDSLQLGLLTGRFLVGASGESDERDAPDKRDGLISWSGLGRYVTAQVSRLSRERYQREQDPEFAAAEIAFKPVVVPQIAAEIGGARDASAWQRAEQMQTWQGFDEYLAQCSRLKLPCRYQNEAFKRSSELKQREDALRDSQLWEQMRISMNYAGYLRECERQQTGCRFRDAAQSLDKPSQSSTGDTEAKLWEAARSIDNMDSYEAYLARFSDGFYAGMARAAIARLRRLEAPQPIPSYQPPPRDREVVAAAPPTPPPPSPSVSDSRPPIVAGVPPVAPLAPISRPTRPSYHYVTGLDPNGWNWLAFRSAPSAQAEFSSTIQLGPDTPVTVLEQSGDYSRIRLRTGETGWAGTRYLTCCREEPSQATYNYISGVSANGWVALRSAPNSQAPFSPDLKLKAGTLFTVIGQRDGFHNVRLRTGETGWVTSSYVACCR